MNVLKDIPLEFYNDRQYCFDYLNSNKTIGNENATYNGAFHLHWRGPIDNDKVILQIKSTLATQEVKKIFFWIENQLITMTSPGWLKLNQFKKFIEVKVFDKSIMDLASGEQKNKDKIWEYYTRQIIDRRFKSDILRFVVLNIYGGVYTDMDTFLLRDLRDIKIENWSSKWGQDPYAEACILKLEKGHDAYEQIYLNNPKYFQCFSMFEYNNPPGIEPRNVGANRAFDFAYDNLKFTALPTSFFDIGWMHNGKDLKCLVLNDIEEFFNETDKEVSLDNFLNGCFSFHWHNRWSYPELKNSFAGKLNENLDRVIENKYGIKPIKIFQG